MKEQLAVGAGLVAAAILWLSGFGVATAYADFGVQSFSATVDQSDGTTSETQAGAHPDSLTVAFSLNTTTGSGGTPVVDGSVKDISVGLPAGLAGNPQAVPRCPQGQLAADGACPAATQVGTATFDFLLFGSVATISSPVFNMRPAAGEAAAFGMTIPAILSIRISAQIRTGQDYGITTTIQNVSEGFPLVGASLTLWGVPADHNGTGSPRVPFLTNPTSCDGPLTATLRVDSWQQPGDFQGATSTLPAPTGCDRLNFAPSITVQPDTATADSPSGLNVDLHVPQNDNADGLAEANLKDATVTLPAGVSINPSAATGLAACTPAEIGLDNATEPSCPNASKIGSAEIDTPLLPDPLTGGIYVAEQDNNPFGSLFAVYVTAQDPVSGVLIKLAGHVVADPVTGQLTTTFSNNPQLPFSDLKLDFFGGSEGILATPQQCGTYTTTSDLSPWSGGPDANPSDSFSIDTGCVSGFAPTFTAGSENAQAGAYSPFDLSFGRADTDQSLSGLTVKLPDGLLAKLAGVGQCSDAQLAAAAAATGTAEAASPSCPALSRVGSVEVSAGVGPTPFSLAGSVYLTGAYKGAPYGLAIVVPAVAGPYDLGTVVVRQALEIDPETTQVTDVSDPFPTILDGIPLDIKQVDVNLNRPEFTVNPTSCDPSSVSGTLTSTRGTVSSVSSRFQVGGCQDIGFSPKLKLALTGKGKTRSGDHPTLTATLTPNAGQANIKTARVALPLSLALDPNNSNNVCPYATAQAVHGGAVGCPASTIVGSASVVTPLLSQPLTGKVYLVQGMRTNSKGQQIRTLPSLLIPLRGQIALDLRAQTSVSGGKLVTTFPSIPDAPVSTFTLKLNGGPKGILVITGRGRSICQANQVGNADLGAQSGTTKTQNMTLSTPCGTPAQETILSRTVNNGFLSVVVKTSERGRLTVTGKGLKGFSRTVSAGTHHIRVAVKKASGGLRSQQRQTTRTVKVEVRLTPANARAATATFTVRM